MPRSEPTTPAPSRSLADVYKEFCHSVLALYTPEGVIDTTALATSYSLGAAVPARGLQLTKAATGKSYPTIIQENFANGAVAGLRTVYKGALTGTAHRALLFNAVPAIKGATHALIPDNCPKSLYGPLAAVLFGVTETAIFLPFDKRYAAKVLAQRSTGTPQLITHPQGMYGNLFKGWGGRNTVASAPGFLAHGYKEMFPQTSDKTLETAAFFGGFGAALLSLPFDRAAALYLKDVQSGVAQPKAVTSHLADSMRSMKEMVAHAIRGDFRNFSKSAKIFAPGGVARGVQIGAWNALSYVAQKDGNGIGVGDYVLGLYNQARALVQTHLPGKMLEDAKRFIESAIVDGQGNLIARDSDGLPLSTVVRRSSTPKEPKPASQEVTQDGAQSSFAEYSKIMQLSAVSVDDTCIAPPAVTKAEQVRQQQRVSSLTSSPAK